MSPAQHLRWAVTGALIVVAALTGCGSSTAQPAATPSTSIPRTSSGTSAAASAGDSSPGTAASSTPVSKVMLIVEENQTYGQVLGSDQAPFLTRLAGEFGSATHMDAGYPTLCPSLAAYIILTSGSDHGICDDAGPDAHPLTSRSIYSQLTAAGKQWRGYAESMTGTCRLTDSADGIYLVRHAPAPYYVEVRADCAAWDVPSGTTTSGALHDDLAHGALPAFSILTPDACHDMHGAPSCGSALVRAGDTWLSQWMPVILESPDYRAGRLVVIITWDEGSYFDNHIPTLVVSPRSRGVSSGVAFTHCSTLRTTEELLGLPLLGCAATASSLSAPFHLV